MRLLLLSLAIVTCLTETANAQESGDWKAGAARVVVTPEKAMWMAGYASRNQPSMGKVHDLYAKALALEDGQGKRWVLVTTDLISVPRPLRDAIAQTAKQEHGLPEGSLTMNCSHTHCGPEIRTTRWSLDGLPPQRLASATEYVKTLQGKLNRLVGEALDNLRPAKVSYCRARSAFAMNRRTPTSTGFRNFPNPDGPVDHDVPVLRIDSPTGQLQTVVFGYACHNTTLGFYQFCGDYAGFAQEYLERANPGVTAMFVLGCGGDQNPYPRRTLELAKQHGQTLANAVEAALDTNATPLPARLSAQYATATVAYQTPPDRGQLETLANSKNKYDKLWGQRLLKQLDEEGKLRTEYDCPVQVVRFGNTLTFVALPGETVVDYSLRLKAEFGGPGKPHIWVAGYSNDVFAYIPSRRVLLEGGYEAGGAMRYMTTVLQPGPFEPDVEERIIRKAHELNKLAAEGIDNAANPKE